MRCLRCHRILKTEESQNLGLGPKCYALVYGSSSSQKKRILRARDDAERHSDVMPGQMTLQEWENSLKDNEEKIEVISQKGTMT